MIKANKLFCACVEVFPCVKGDRSRVFIHSEGVVNRAKNFFQGLKEDAICTFFDIESNLKALQKELDMLDREKSSFEVDFDEYIAVLAWFNCHIEENGERTAHCTALHVTVFSRSLLELYGETIFDSSFQAIFQDLDTSSLDRHFQQLTADRV